MRFLRPFGLLVRGRALIAILPLMVRIGWRLVRDPRVRRRDKAVLLAALGYVVSPLDLVPDFVPWIGKLDDALVVIGAVVWAIESLPPAIVDEHLAALGVTRTEVNARARGLLPRPVGAILRRLLRRAV